MSGMGAMGPGSLFIFNGANRGRGIESPIPFHFKLNQQGEMARWAFDPESPFIFNRTSNGDGHQIQDPPLHLK